MPKLAFLNSGVAHESSYAYSEVALDAEALDIHFAEMLTHMLQRPDADDTVILIRGDHGIQQGAQMADYSFQVFLSSA